MRGGESGVDMKPEDLYDKVDRLTSRDGWVADTQTKAAFSDRLVWDSSLCQSAPIGIDASVSLLSTGSLKDSYTSIRS